MALQMQLSFTALLLSVVTAALSEPLSALLNLHTVLAGIVAAALLSAGIKWCEQCTLSQVARHNMQVVILLWLCAELAQVFVRAVLLCQRAFSSLALIGVAPFLVWVSWKLPLDRWANPAKVLLWMSILIGIVFLLGIAGQLRWERLFELERADETGWMTPIYAEYFFLPVIHGTKQNSPHKSRVSRLPWVVFLAQFLTAMVFQLLFGKNDRSALEVLRVWNLGSVSRMDSALLLVWLTCAIFRICVLCGMIRVVWTLVQKNSIRKGT